MTQILSGDRHLALEGKPIAPGLFTLATNSNTSFSWTEELHSKGRQPGGILLSLDGHSEFSGAARLAKIVQRQPLATNRLLIP